MKRIVFTLTINADFFLLITIYKYNTNLDEWFFSLLATLNRMIRGAITIELKRSIVVLLTKMPEFELAVTWCRMCANGRSARASWRVHLWHHVAFVIALQWPIWMPTLVVCWCNVGLYWAYGNIWPFAKSVVGQSQTLDDAFFFYITFKSKSNYLTFFFQAAHYFILLRRCVKAVNDPLEKPLKLDSNFALTTTFIIFN